MEVESIQQRKLGFLTSSIRPWCMDHQKGKGRRESTTNDASFRLDDVEIL
ncbi:hypothetical protein V6Z11_D02G144700 [Gossypium hirsutum]